MFSPLTMKNSKQEPGVAGRRLQLGNEMRFGSVTLAAATLLWTGAAVAQQPGNMPASAGQQQQQQQMPGSMNQPNTSPTGTMPETMAAQPLGDISFVHETLENNVAEVAMSQLAQTKSQSQDVQQFGQKMVQIRTQLSDQLKPVAKQLGVDDPKGPSKKQKQEIAKLEQLSGPDFDSAYIQAMASEQKKSLKAFKEEETSTQNPGLEQAAKADEPTLSQHYEVLQKLAQAHNVTIAEAK